MRKPTPEELANAFLWLAVLAASIILLWASDKLWMMVVAILGCGWASTGLFARHCRRDD